MCEFGLNQEILMEYLDGVADVSIAAHIVGCRHCRDGVIMLANAQSKFREMVSPLLCVDEMRLGEYYLGTLGMDASLAVNLHVQVCEHCRARLDAISSFTDGKARSPEILYPLLSQSPASHGVGAVRNGGFRQRKELTYFIHEAEINLEIEKAGKDFAIWGW